MKYLVLMLLLLVSNVLFAETNSNDQISLNPPTLWGLKWDLRQMVIADNYRHYLEKNNLIAIDLSLLHPTATGSKNDLGYNKTHVLPQGKSLTVILKQIESTYDFKIRGSAYISIFTRKNVYMVRYMSLDEDDRNLGEYIASKGDVILVSLRSDFY
jgi:hypothetical protein